MKKGTIISVLLIITIVSAYCISGTYAKYTSEFKGSDTARVAEWKFDYTNEADLFATLYDTKDTSFKPPSGPDKHIAETDIAPGKIIAPGTFGEYKFRISGSAETSYKIQFDFTGSEDNTGGRITYFWNGMSYKTIQALQEGMNGTYDELIFAPGTSPGSGLPGNEGTDMVQTINVVWDYENTEDTDKLDTALGVRAAQGEEIIVKLVAKIIITQVD